MKGFFFFSSPSIVFGPCPEYMVVLSGNGKIFCFILSISSLGFPPGKSVLPTDPLKITSPPISTPLV